MTTTRRRLSRRAAVAGIASLTLFAAACGDDDGGSAGAGGSDVPPENSTLTFTPPESEQIAQEGCPDFYVSDVTEQLRWISYSSDGTWEDVEVTADEGDKRVNGARTCVFTVKNLGIESPNGNLDNLTLTTLGASGDYAGFDEMEYTEWVYNRGRDSLDTIDGIDGISGTTDDGVKMADQAGLGATDVHVSSDGVRVRFTSSTSALVTGFERTMTPPFRGSWALVETGDNQDPDYVGETSATQLARVFADAFLISFTYDKSFWRS